MPSEIKQLVYDINSVIDKYKGFIDKVDRNIEMFPDDKPVLLARKNIYLDVITDLQNTLSLSREVADERVTDIHD